jgi:hypothetical protein
MIAQWSSNPPANPPPPPHHEKGGEGVYAKPIPDKCDPEARHRNSFSSLKGTE